MVIEMSENETITRIFDPTIKLAENAMLRHRPDLFDEWDFEKNDALGLNIYKVSRGSSRKAWWICREGHSVDTAIANRVNRKGCRICDNKEILIGFNDMWTTNPELALLLADPMDGYKYTQVSNKKVDWVCPDCDNPINQKYINNTKRVGLSCPKCSDGISFPEKFIYHILRDNKVEFEFEKIFPWAKRKKYDFYLHSLNCIIEIHGEHHFTGKYKNTYMRDEKGNDSEKKLLAIENGIDHYIELDARISSGFHIRESILQLDSPMKIWLISDFQKAEERASNTLMKETWDLWESGLGVNQIANELNLCRPTVRKYLKRGAFAGKCDYTIEKSKRRGRDFDSMTKATSVVQLDKNLNFIRIWSSFGEAANEFKTHSSSIHSCCQKKNKTAGGFRWMYEEDYHKEVNVIV